ncbi:MAG: hypothetical protein AAGA54_00950 [Myxococcota bacterium]
MTKQIKLLSLFVALGLGACDSGSSDSATNEGPGGKADDTEDFECAPLEELTIELVGRDKNESVDGDQLTNSVTATCFNNEGFENSACCAEAGLFEAYQEATSCPERVVLNAPEGNASQQRCADAATGQFVSSACCSDICDPAARPNSAGQCIDSNGQFEDSMCCFLAASLEADACEGAAWESLTIGGEDRMACRNQNTGKFAMNSCCAAECVQAIGEEEFGVESIPAACEAAVDLEAPEAECPDLSTENSAGICHNPENGQFVKAACCDAKGGDAKICHWDTVPQFGAIEGYEDEDGGYVDPSNALLEQIADYSYDDVDASASIDATLRSQIEATMLHLGFILPGQESDDDALFYGSDERSVIVINGALDDVELTWIRFYSGDTEVGVIFEPGSTNVLAEIGDGDIQGCE